MQFSLSVPSFEKSESVSINMWHEKCIGQQLQALLGAFIAVGASYPYNAWLLKTQPVPAYISPWILSRPFMLICIEKKIMLEHDQNFSFCVFHKVF
jgi:hypothetical protein